MCIKYEVKLFVMFKVMFFLFFTAAQPLIKSLRYHGNIVMCLAADDRYIISGSNDCTVAVYDRRAGRNLKRIRVNANMQHSVMSLHLCPFMIK